MKVIYEDNHLLVVEKPANIPMQADSSKDEDLLSMAKSYIKEKYNKPGEVYLGLVHRLDRPVGGVCVFARTSKAAGRLSRQIQDHTFKKTYLAVVEDHGLEDSGHFEDCLLKDEHRNIVRVDPKGKPASLDYEKKRRSRLGEGLSSYRQVPSDPCPVRQPQSSFVGRSEIQQKCDPQQADRIMVL